MDSAADSAVGTRRAFDVRGLTTSGVSNGRPLVLASDERGAVIEAAGRPGVAFCTAALPLAVLDGCRSAIAAARG